MSRHETKRAGRPTDLAKREAVIEAATRSFFEAGYDGTSIAQVAADAGVSKVTIYNRFGDKRGLFSAAVEAECERLRTAFAVDLSTSGSLRERLTAIGEAITGFLSRPEMVQFERRIAAETERDPAIGQAFLMAGPYRMKAAFVALLQAMRAAGEITVEDVDLAAEQFVSLCKGMGDLERRFGHPHDAALQRQRIVGAVELFCKAYAAAETDRTGGG